MLRDGHFAAYWRVALPGPDLSVWRAWVGSLLEARVVGCWCGCLSEARCGQLCDLRINCMTYTLFLFQIIGFKKYFYVSLGNIFFCFFCGGPLVVEAPGQLPSLPPPLKSGLCVTVHRRLGRRSPRSVMHAPQL